MPAGVARGLLYASVHHRWTGPDRRHLRKQPQGSRGCGRCCFFVSSVPPAVAHGLVMSSAPALMPLLCARRTGLRRCASNLMGATSSWIGTALPSAESMTQGAALLLMRFYLSMTIAAARLLEIAPSDISASNTAPKRQAPSSCANLASSPDQSVLV